MDSNDERPIDRVAVDALLRRLLAIDIEPSKARIEEEIIRRRLAVI